MAAPFDSVSICLSKGLGAPVGSVLVGARSFIDAARRWRKMLGGGMRQAGMLAAAGQYALTHHVERLQEDHVHAAQVADALKARFGAEAATQATNMVHVHLHEDTYRQLRRELDAAGVSVGRPRWVFHLDVAAADVDKIVNVIRSS